MFIINHGGSSRLLFNFWVARYSPVFWFVLNNIWSLCRTQRSPTGYLVDAEYWHGELPA